MEPLPGDAKFFEVMESHRVRGWIRLMRMLPAEPRCAICRAPFGGFGGKVVGPFGFAPSRKNPRFCKSCFDHLPEGGLETTVGVLFADVRGYTELTERHGSDEMAALMNRFYAAATEVICRHGILDKFVGDQVMALYFPGFMAGHDPLETMVADAQEILAAATPQGVELGIGIDMGSANVGNVGPDAVKDFTAIGDVVNTAARLQGVAAAGEIVVSRRAAPDGVPGGAAQSFALKGKAEPVEAFVLTSGVTPTRSSPAAST